MTDWELITGSNTGDVIVGLLMMVVGYWAYRRRLLRGLVRPFMGTQWSRKRDSRFRKARLRWLERVPFLALVIVGMMIALGAILG